MDLPGIYAMRIEPGVFVKVFLGFCTGPLSGPASAKKKIAAIAATIVSIIIPIQNFSGYLKNITLFAIFAINDPLIPVSHGFPGPVTGKYHR
jgi:hypothetical protein